MIPSFLRSLVTLLLRLIGEGKAVHCTEADAVELEMLAGLPWDKSDLVSRKPIQPSPFTEIIGEIFVSDIVLGWLRAAKAIEVFSDKDPRQAEYIQRAAACAEFVALSVLALIPMTAQFGGELRVETHLSGSIEGARAAWSFVVERLTVSAADMATGMDRGGGKTGHVLPLMEMADRYRRELEAMK